MFAVAILKLAYPQGLEPRLTVLETAVLPLHQEYINWLPRVGSNYRHLD